ncbi:hypothetical protein AB205_0006500 [Aquarana catesbeiana]|uniref:Uncharacterized protein n=1 Tax=Aquarana catesbeiana TaxID=8400 RepID=A0A2G9P1R6_AQUCT|nr:hypothetical protein AB205_0006500 [Aquarana catesbeiana]
MNHQADQKLTCPEFTCEFLHHRRLNFPSVVVITNVMFCASSQHLFKVRNLHSLSEISENRGQRAEVTLSEESTEK